jgi:DNA-directed RNA polymerase specialized sigma24 family protein
MDDLYKQALDDAYCEGRIDAFQRREILRVLKERISDDEFLVDEVDLGSYSMERLFLDHERRVGIERVIDDCDIPPKAKCIGVMHYIEGMSIPEIAREYGCCYGNVRYHTLNFVIHLRKNRKSRRRLKQFLD